MSSNGSVARPQQSGAKSRERMQQFLKLCYCSKRQLGAFSPFFAVVAQFEFLRVLCVSVVNVFPNYIHHGGTEGTEI
jgi:hypothetical protein